MSVAAQAKAIFLAGVGIQAAAGAIYGISHFVTARRSWEGAAAIIAGLGISPLFLAAILALWVYVQGKKLRQLAAGQYYVHWRYTSDEWQPHCKISDAKLSNSARTITLVVTGMMLLLAVGVHSDGNLAFDSIVKHYAAFVGTGLVAGYAIGVFCQYCGNITHKLKQSRTAQALIGPGGIYLTGQFWPLATFGQHLRSVKIADDDPDNICFTFEVRTKHGSTETFVLVPIPPDQREVAQSLVEVIEQDFLAEYESSK